MRTTQEPFIDSDFGESSRIASDFAELQGEESRKVDSKVNRFFLALCAGIIGYAVGAALGYW
jgi:hypothetical protein